MAAEIGRVDGNELKFDAKTTKHERKLRKSTALAEFFASKR